MSRTSTILAMFVIIGVVAEAQACDPYTMTNCSYAQKWNIRSEQATADAYAREEARQDRMLDYRIAKEEARALRSTRTHYHYHGCRH